MERVNGKDGAQTVSRAFELLQCFTIDQPSLSVAQLSARTGLTVPTTYRLLKALLAMEMVYLDPLSRRYSLGVGVMRLASVIMQRDDVQAVALPHLRHLQEITSETVGLHWLMGHEQVCVVEVVSPHPIRMVSGVGRVYPLYGGASGKALLAWLPEEELGEYLQKTELRPFIPGHQITQESLLADVADVRRLGYAMTFGEIVDGAAALAAPILNSGGRPIAAVYICGPENRWNPSQMLRVVDALLSATAQIMQQIGRDGLPAEHGARDGTGVSSARVRTPSA